MKYQQGLTWEEIAETTNRSVWQVRAECERYKDAEARCGHYDQGGDQRRQNSLFLAFLLFDLSSARIAEIQSVIDMFSASFTVHRYSMTP